MEVGQLGQPFLRTKWRNVVLFSARRRDEDTFKTN